MAAQAADPPLNRLIEIFRSGKSAVGTFVRLDGLDAAAHYAGMDFDFVIFDLEHRPTDYSSLRNMLQGMLDRADIVRRGSLQPKVVPLIRVASNAAERNQYLIKHALDLGAYGVVLPHADTATDVASAVAAARYPRAYDGSRGLPAGVRGASPGIAARYWGLIAREYIRRAEVWPISAEGELCVVPMIESREAVERIEEILEVPGVSAIFIGPGDLSVSFGHPGYSGSVPPEVDAAMLTVLRACQRANIPCGTLVSAADIETRVSQGFRFLVLAGGEDLSSGTLKRARTLLETQ